MATEDRAELLRTLGRRVREKIARDLEREDAESAARRADVLPRLRAAVANARETGLCTSVVLFGSYAWGRPHGRSDVDLLVEGAADPILLAARVSRAIGLEVHAIDRKGAPPSLVARALADGIAL